MHAFYLRHWYIAILALCFSALSLAEGHHAESKSFKVTEIKAGFYFLQGKGGNILVSKGSDGLLVVDSDYADMSPALEHALEGIGGKLKYLVNTHWHGDHTQGNQTLGHHADIIAHENVRKRLNSRQEVKLFNMVSEPYPEQALPNVTFDSSLTLHMNDDTIKALHLPNGHTDGDSIILFENANVVHMGDHFFNGFFPFVDLDSGGNVRNMAKNIAMILEQVDDDTIIVPGHGPLANKEDLNQFRKMLLGTSKEVEAMKQSGLNMGQAQAKGLSEQWQPWTKGFLNEAVWIGIVYKSL